MTERKLATIRQIHDIQPIVGADQIDVASVDGWKVVIKKNEFRVGDFAVYFEIDSWIPHTLAPFLSKDKEPREYSGIKGQKLRTVKLRGQISQGLLLSCDQFPELAQLNMVNNLDVTDVLGIQKWEAPIAANLQGQVAGPFPTNLIPKTQQERIQNCFTDIEQQKDLTYEVTIKLDGSSMTLFRWQDELRVCSRTIELILTPENATNVFVDIAIQLGDQVPNGLAFQGELMGPGVQGNRENLLKHEFFIFDIFNIQNQKYEMPEARRLICEQLGFRHVPIVSEAQIAPDSVDEALALADGPSLHADVREGLVWKCNENDSVRFKTISNDFLLKNRM